ncbi:ankyrin repeat-containing protein, putative [Ricinus communis]|uniref:Ankyrin repeat-containing protein, putative n=2 Tax=Ricinus communis TaxID=3988 RepID=B9RMI8_RICCO|nr:ankyrin repeat-containing protein, putative [Ricinus communis]
MLFRGYATTAAVREGHLDVLEVLMKAGASQEACEEALLEASYLGQARHAELLMGSDLIRPQVAVHALVTACCRGFVNVVDTLIKCGVDANAIDRVLLRSSKPSLYANVDCNALAAAVVSRQTSVVRLLLQVNVRMDIKVKLGAWSWDMDTGEEFRVGAGLAEAYLITWCAVEYFEASGAILRMLLRHFSPNILHFGRSLIHHAILCNNARAAEVILNCGADKEFPVKTTSKNDWRPVHLAARLGSVKVLEQLIVAGCNLNSRTDSGETALMVCAKYKQKNCLKVLASAGADFGLVNSAGQSVSSIAMSTRWALGFQEAVVTVIQAGKNIKSSNASVFSPLMFVIQANDIEALKKLIERSYIDLDEQDDDGFSAAMIAAAGGHVEAFRLLVYAGANIKLENKYGETAIRLSELNHHDEVIEKVMLEYALEEGYDYSAGIHALHRAARRGDLNLVSMLVKRGYDINASDDDGYTPLMLAAMGGRSRICQLLISCGASCDIENARRETALLIARKNGYYGDETESVILDELARQLVLGGARVKKHTRGGKGAPHYKELRMVGTAGVLRWGKSSKRNVICRGAEVGPSSKFRWNRRRKFDVEDPGMFHVITTKNKEVHFVCEGGTEMAELWVRGIKLVTREAIFGKKKSEL